MTLYSEERIFSYKKTRSEDRNVIFADKGRKRRGKGRTKMKERRKYYLGNIKYRDVSHI